MDVPRSFLTEPERFRDVSRGNPRPHSLRGEAAVQARLTQESWRLEIVGEAGARVETPRTLEAKNAITFDDLERLGRQHAKKYFKAMQCLNIAQPLGQGLWEGVPLREVLKLAGRISELRRIYYWGFHNNDPKQVFRSSLSYSQVMDSAPGELPALVAYKLNGQPISLLRGGPVRMIVPWAYGFKSIKWLQQITLTNDFRANDTYADNNNDPESYLKTAAYIDEGPAMMAAGRPVTITGAAMVGLPGLKRVEYWLRPDAGTHGNLPEGDPAWRTARWLPCEIEPAPKDWGGALPQGTLPREVWGVDPRSGQPREWPMRYSWVLWSASLGMMKPGTYEFRVRTVDQHDFAQPEPRPYPKSGRNEIQYKQIIVP